MVSMQMRYKYVIQSRKFQTRFTELQLCTFPAINHKQLIAHIHYLRSRKMTCCGQCGTTAEYMQFKLFHDKRFRTIFISFYRSAFNSATVKIYSALSPEVPPTYR